MTRMEFLIEENARLDRVHDHLLRGETVAPNRQHGANPDRRWHGWVYGVRAGRAGAWGQDDRPG